MLVDNMKGGRVKCPYSVTTKPNSNQMTITPAQIAKLAKDHATDFAEKVDIQFLMEFYIENYLDASYDDIESVMSDILTHNNKDRKSTLEFMIESGIDPKDAEEVITNTLDGILVD